MELDPSQPIPIYFQLKTLLLEEILKGRYGADGRLPTEHELCLRFGISRTPVSRALSELADEGLILRHRRRGTFVNSHGLRRRPDQPEVRVVVSEQIWGQVIRDAAPPGIQVNVVTVALPSLHQVLTHAVAEGRAPDLAILDSVWIAEFAASGFLYALEDLDEHWVRYEHEVDFLEPLVSSNRSGGRTFGVSAFGSVAGIWYRRRELAALGLEPPGTWDELRAVARALADSGLATPFVMPGGSIGGETTTYCLIAFLASNGARVLDGESISIDTPETAETLAFLRSLIDDGLMPADVVAYEWTRPVRLLAEGKAALSVGGSYEAQTLAEAFGVSMGELWEHVGFIPGSGRAQRPRGERRRLDELRDLPAVRPAAARDARARACGRAAGARPARAGDRPGAGAAIGGGAGRARPAVPLAVRRDPRQRGDAAPHSALSPRVEAAPDDARGGVDRTARARGGGRARRRPDRGDHRPPRRPRARGEDAGYSMATAVAARVAESTVIADAVPATAQTMPPATNIAGAPTKR